MPITEDDIARLATDPSGVQRKIIEMIEGDGDITINDPTNPFMMLLEADAQLTRAAIEETTANKRNAFPTLAKTEKELFNHIQDDDLIDMVAVASKGSFAMLVNASDFIGKGYRSPTDNNIVSMVIPKYTKIVVVDTMFTLMNDLRLQYNIATRSYMVENIANDHPLALNNLGVLRSSVSTDTSGAPWIAFEYHARQIRRTTFEDTIHKSTAYKKEIDLEGEQYYYSEVYTKSTLTGDVYVKLSTSMSGFVYDPTNPTVHIAVEGSIVTFSIPYAYIANDLIANKIMVVLYTTKGNIYIESSKYGPDKFDITLGDTTVSDETSVSKNIMLLTTSNFNLEGGKDQRTFTELRDIVINDATGQIERPITEFEMERYFGDLGYNVEKILDSVTERRYLTTKSLPIDTSVIDKPIMDTYLSRIVLITGEYDNNKYFYKSYNVAVIKPGAIFESTDAGTRMLNTAEVNALELLPFEDLKTALQTTKHFYSPYCYVSNIVNNIATLEAYDVANPSVSNLNILSKFEGEFSVNIDKYGVLYTDTGYSIYLTAIASGTFSDIAADVKLQLAIPVKNTDAMAYFYADYDQANERFVVNITSNMYINSDNGLVVTNGESVHSTIILGLSSTCYATIFTVDNVTDIGAYSVQQNVFSTSYPNAKPLAEETLTLTLGEHMKYLYTNVSTEYTERKYKTYPTDIELRYEDDVFERDPVTGSSLIPVYENGVCVDMEYNITHNAGDIVLDSDGNIIYKFKAGDVMLGTDDKPILDGELGVMRLMDINMLEYEYKRAESAKITDYLSNALTNLKKFVTSDMVEANEKMLDNTIALYANNTPSGNIKVALGAVTYNVPATTRPEVIVYVKQEVKDSITDTAAFKTHIGRIIHTSIKTGVVDLVGIKNDIVEQLTSDVVYSVTIKGLAGDNDLEKFATSSESESFGINKLLDLDINGDITISYDIDFTIQYI